MGTDDQSLPPVPRWYGNASNHDQDEQSHLPSGPESAGEAGNPSDNDADPVDKRPEETDVSWPPEHEGSENDDRSSSQQESREFSPGEALRVAGQALFSRDLIQPGPGWPVGKRARQRQQQRREAADRARQRRQQLQHGIGEQQSPISMSTPWQQVPPARNARVIAALAGLVAAVAAATWWFTSDDEPPRAPAPTGRPAAPHRPAPPAGTLLLPQPAIPPGGVAPVVPHPPTRTPNPAAVSVVPAPTGPPSVAELATPTLAAKAWMARWCPFDYREPYGASQQRARPAMTSTGWDGFDPNLNDQARRSWQTTVEARESAQCSTPQAQISPEAPSSDTSMVVLVHANRVVTGPTAPPYVEPVTSTRRVTHSPDGQWRVDTETQGG